MGIIAGTFALDNLRTEPGATSSTCSSIVVSGSGAGVGTSVGAGVGVGVGVGAVGSSTSEQSLSPQTIPAVAEPYLEAGVPCDLSPSVSWTIGRPVIDTKRKPKVRKIRIFFVILLCIILLKDDPIHSHQKFLSFWN